jgi:hypothetical protein
MSSTEEGRIEELSKKVGGRFRLTALVQKQAREYVRGGGAFMPRVRNLDELFRYILDEVEQGRIRLLLPAEKREEESEEEE